LVTRDYTRLARRFPVWLLAVVPLLPVLGLGFFNDDYTGLALLGSGGWHEVWEFFHPSHFEFLRPLTVVVFKLELGLLGERAGPLHAAHLGLFVLAAWLTARLAARIAPAAAAWAPALALLYPGRLETVAWVAALFDLLALVLVLASLLLCTTPRWEGRPAKTVLLTAACFVSPLAKESAYALPLVVVGWEVLGVLPPAPRRARLVRSGAALAGAAAAAGFRLLALGGIGGYRDTTAGAALERLPRLPEMLARLLFVPVNTSYGRAATWLAISCAATMAVAALGLVRGDAAARRLALAGLVLLVAGLLPPLAYLQPATLAWSHSRFIALPGAGVVLLAASGLAGWRRASPVLGALLAVAWAGTTLFNLQPYLWAARGRDAIVATVDAVTRSPHGHDVWIAGPILMYRGAQLLGGRAQDAISRALPGRDIRVDSEFAQRDQRRQVGPPPPVERREQHLFRFDPDGPALLPIDSFVPVTPPSYAW
jgi:hypothetical protein